MPHRHYTEKRLALFLVLLLTGMVCVGLTASVKAAPGDVEYFGKLDGDLIPYTEDLDQVIFKPLRDLSKVKLATTLDSDVKVTAGRLYHPLQDKNSILTLLVEPNDDGEPYIYADLNTDGTMSDNERFPLKRDEEGNPYILQATLNLPINGSLFKSYPVFVQYLKNVRWDELGEDERL